MMILSANWLALCLIYALKPNELFGRFSDSTVKLFYV